MRTVTKKELITRISEETKVSKADTRKVIQGFLENIADELIRGNRMEFRDFGVFEVKVRKARQAQNPKTLEKVMVPAHRVVFFKEGRRLKLRLAGKEE